MCIYEQRATASAILAEALSQAREQLSGNEQVAAFIKAQQQYDEAREWLKMVFN
jgi:hypothetical protein